MHFSAIGITAIFAFLQLAQISSVASEREGKQYEQLLGSAERAEQGRRDLTAEEKCKALASSFVAPSGLKLNNTFSQFFPEGSALTLESLTKLYPNGTIPDDVKIDRILDSVGPDVDLRSQAGYGRLNSRATQNGPAGLGGLPAFCRFGTQVATSDVTSILSEVWLPLPSDPNTPLVTPEIKFPTNTTPYEISQDGNFVTAPLYYLDGQYKKVKPAPGSQDPPAPNDVPAPPSTDSKNATNARTSTDTQSTPTSTSQNDTKSTTSSKESQMKKKRSVCSSVHSSPGEEILGQNNGWNGRIVVIGHGGQLGFVPLVSMKQYMARYNFVVAGTNLGHYSVTSGVTWVNDTQFSETLLDFGSRANHITLQLAESAVDQFYGKDQGLRNPKENGRLYRYYAGSSVGGARGLAASQVYPGDFNGIIAGAPAVSFMSMNVAQIKTSSLHNKTVVGNDGFFTKAALYKTIKDVVTSQCDGLDGVEDGIISEPSLCKPELEKELLCGTDTKYGKTNLTCLTQKQIDVAYQLYKPTIIENEEVYPAYWPGLEDSASSFNPSNSKSSGWHQLVVLKKPKLDPKFNPFTDIKLADLKAGIAADPGGVNAAKTDLSAFIKKGGKLILYHGSYDLVVSPQSTVNYFTAAKRDTAAALQVPESQIAKSMKFYTIFGMRHSRSGPGAVHFGGPSQNDAGHRPYKFESGYDMTLALMAWVEKGIEPNAQIAARYNLKEKFMPPRDVKGGDPDIDLPIPDIQQNYAFGLKNTRLLCPYPAKAVYQAGSNPDGEDGYKAFKCV